MRGAWSLLLAAALGFGIAEAHPRTFEPRLDSGLQRRLDRIAAESQGVCGIVVRHLSNGRFAEIRKDEAFPLASTYKLPIAVVALRAVDRRTLSLGEQVHLRAADMTPGVSVLTDRHPEGDVDVSVHELLDLMLTTSDNTACDALIRRLGGGPAITRELRAMGIENLRVDRTEREIGNTWFGLMPTPGDTAWSAKRLTDARSRVRPTRRAYADREFSRDPRDTGSPEALADLLVQIWERRALSAAATDTLVAMMGRCSTGRDRLRAGLPAQVRLAHRTGTGGPWNDHSHAVNDVGVITLPGGGGQVAIVVLVRDAHGSLSNTEKTIADVARAVFDAWNAPE